MEQSAGFSVASKFVAVHWRLATWEEISALGSIDSFPAPRHWNRVRHRWVLFEPADKKANFGWAYSRTSDPNFPTELSDVRYCHQKHLHLPNCPLLDLDGVIQLAGDERIPVHIGDFINLNKPKSRCDLESEIVVDRIAGILKKAHPGSWIKPQ